jgi:acetyl-CoA C-acetyltransferase
VLSDAPRRACILGGNRIPFARSGGSYTHLSNQDMLSVALNGLIERFGLQGERLGEVAGGAVLKHSRDRDLTRESVLGSELSPETPAYDVQQACATGLETAILVANKIALGQIDVGIACGADTTSEAPIALSEPLRRALLDANRQRSTLGKVRALSRVRPAHLLPSPPRNEEPRTGLSMGEHCAQMATQWEIGRDDQDQLTFESHRKLAAAYERGFMDDLLTPHVGLERDENLRADTTLERLTALPPVFGGAHGSLTAANSTPLSDGASAVLLSSEDWAAEHDLGVLAYLTGAQTAAVDHVGEREGLLMAPVHAMPRLLERAGLQLQDFDYVEIHEAFAAQVLCTLAAWEDSDFCRTRLRLAGPLGAVERERLNINGGSLAAGHPFAATGGRILTALAKQLSENGSGRGVISICAADGQGVLATLESAGGV